MTRRERLDLAQHAARLAYAHVLDVDGEGDGLEAIDCRVMALLYAAVWAAVERGSPRPWLPGNRHRSGPAMTRTEFLTYAADIFDVWQQGKPGAHLTVIDGGRR